MNWLITGGCGFIGKNLIKFLQTKDANFSFRIIDNLSVGKKEDLYYAVSKVETAENVSELNWKTNQTQLIVGDIRDEELALEVTKGADVIVHLAANTGVFPSVQNPRLDCVTNIVGTLNYLEGCRENKVNRFVFASSGAPVGECVPPIHEELACHPVSPYGASKMAGEGYCSAYNRTFEVDTVALRFGNVYGPGSTHKSSVVAKFIRQAMNDEICEIYGDGTQTRDFIFTEDLVNAIWLAAIKEGIGGEVFQIATNRETNLIELVEALKNALEDAGFQEFKYKHGPKRLGDVMRNFSDTTKAKNQLGWETQNTLQEGLKQTIDFFLQKD